GEDPPVGLRPVLGRRGHGILSPGGGVLAGPGHRERKMSSEIGRWSHRADRSPPEAIEGVVGDELEGLLEAEDRPERADGAPSLVVWVPVQDLEEALPLGSEACHGDAVVFPHEGVAAGVLADGDAAAVLIVEDLDLALDEVQYDRLPARYRRI